MRSFGIGAWAAAARPTVVLLHSSASSSRQWGGLAELLGARFDVRALDLHGHGAQPPWPAARPLALADEVALVEPILREAGRVHLVGHSYGGAVALQAAAMHSHSVRSVTVYEPVLFRWLFDGEPDSDAAREVHALADGIRGALHRRSFSTAAEGFVDYWSGRGAWGRLSPTRQQVIATRMPAVLAHFDALFGEPFAIVPDVRRPLLFLSGADSPRSTRRIAAIARGRLPATTCETLPAMGHMGPITHSEVVYPRIERFLSHCERELQAQPAQRCELRTDADSIGQDTVQRLAA